MLLMPFFLGKVLALYVAVSASTSRAFSTTIVPYFVFTSVTEDFNKHYNNMAIS